MTLTEGRLLHRRGLRPLLIAEVVSTVGSQLTAIALPWFVLTTSGSPARASLVLAAEMAPVALFGIVSGSWAQRVGARRWMVLADATRAPLVAAVPVLALVGLLPFWGLLAVVFAVGTFAASYTASQQVVLADLVGDDPVVLSRATSLLQSATRLTVLLGPPAAGVLIAVMGARAVLLLDAMSYLAAAVLVVLAVPRSIRSAAQAATGVLAGIRFLFADRLLGLWSSASVLSEAAYQALFLTLQVLVIARYHASATLVGLLLGAFGGGALAGSLLAMRLLRRRPPRRLALIGKLGQTVAFLPLVVALPPYVVAVVLVLLGVFNGIANGPTFAVRMGRTPVGLRPQVLTAATTVTMLGGTAGLLSAGPALEALPISGVIAGMAVLQVASAGLFFTGAGHAEGAAHPVA